MDRVHKTALCFFDEKKSRAFSFIAKIICVKIELIKSKEGDFMYRETAQEMLSFIEKNPTAFHAVNTMKQMLSKAGYRELAEHNAWQIEKGGKYFVCRNASSIIAFRVGNDPELYGFRILAAHTDSPTFKVKEKAELSAGKKYIRLNTEGYGGMICSSWMDRPLSVAGRVLLRQTDGRIVTRLLDFRRDLVLIPNVAIHMNRKINDGYAYNKQVDMLPLFSMGNQEGEKNSLMALAAAELQVAEEDILGSDLYLYSRTKASIWGCHEEFLSAGRLDDQECLFGGLKALLETENAMCGIHVLACFDNEEVGSGSKQGADSTFLQEALRRISSALGMTEESYYRALAASFMLSADNAQAVNPSHPEYTDAENCVYMNEGVVLKSHAGQKYTSDGMSIAIVRELARKANVPLQYFSNRSDKVGGSTLGNIAMAQVSMNAADIGLAQLAMHSAYETAGVKDVQYLVDLVKAFYGSQMQISGETVKMIDTVFQEQ